MVWTLFTVHGSDNRWLCRSAHHRRRLHPVFRGFIRETPGSEKPPALPIDRVGRKFYPHPAHRLGHRLAVFLREATALHRPADLLHRALHRMVSRLHPAGQGEHRARSRPAADQSHHSAFAFSRVSLALRREGNRNRYRRNRAEAFNFLREFTAVDKLKDRGEEMGEADERTIVDLLSDQKPSAQHEGWLDSLVEHTPETEEYGISNFVYRSRIPFHSQRIFDLFETEWPGVIRSKGIFWLATRLKYAGFWSQAGALGKHQCAGHFWSAVSKIQWPDDHRHIEAIWEEPNGDCRQEIVLIGTKMDHDALTAMFDAALLTAEEFNSPPEEWANRFKDPFPLWNMGLQGKPWKNARCPVFLNKFIDLQRFSITIWNSRK